jgi:uncharacterized protein
VAGDGEEILLPNRYLTNDMKVGMEVSVFLTTDSEDRLVALTDKPSTMVDEFGVFTVVDATGFGAFVDWGLPKDLFVPKKNQKKPFVKAEKKILRVVYDPTTDRLIGDEHIGRYLSKDVPVYEKGQEVDLLVFAKTDLGFKVIVDNLYEGLVFHKEIFETVYVGQKRKGFAKLVREDDKLDISINPIGEQRKSNAAEKVLAILTKNGGKMEFTYKSDAEDIKKKFQLSKKNFKAALTQLISEKKITLEETVGIALA